MNDSNRGLTFDPEMLWYCGREARVLRRVERIVDERTGRLLRLKRPCIVLEDVTCRGEYHRCCPRADYPFWREIWLERLSVRPCSDHCGTSNPHPVRPRTGPAAHRSLRASRRGRWMQAADRRREAPFGVSSEGRIALHELAIDSENRTLGFLRAVTRQARRHALLLNIEEDLGRFDFIDFGSGKGRVLLVASHYPFRQVIGVEFSPELHEIAQENIRRYQSPARRCQAVLGLRRRRNVRAPAACMRALLQQPVRRSDLRPSASQPPGGSRACAPQGLRSLSAARRRPGDRPHAQHRDAAGLRLPP